MPKQISIQGEIAVIPLTRGQVAIIDAADVALVSHLSWNADPRKDGDGFYARARGGLRLHRVIMGVTERHIIVDHEDGDGLNCRRGNMRIGTQGNNCVNRRRTPGGHLRGAYRDGNRWFSQIKIAGEAVRLGRFDSEAEAHAAYLAKARELHGDWLPAHLR